MSGSVEMSIAELWRGLRSTDALAHALVYELRLPRTLTAFAAGGVLALAGVLMQVLLRNPLADPFVMEFPAALPSLRCPRCCWVLADC
jgi:iron complex transport system permease protein